MKTRRDPLHLKRTAGSLVNRYYCQKAASGKLPRIPLALYHSIGKHLIDKHLWRLRNCDHWLTLALPREHPARACIREEWNDGWALSPTTGMAVWHLLEQLRPSVVLEFGCGLSTALFANYCHRALAMGRPRPRVISVEHESTWITQTSKLLEENALGNIVDFVHAPLSEQSIMGEQHIAYTLETEALTRLIPPTGVDFVFIDGPPGVIGRIGGLPLIANKLCSGAHILLDDAYRPGEDKVWATWATQLRGRLTKSQMILTSRGLASGRWQ